MYILENLLLLKISAANNDVAEFPFFIHSVMKLNGPFSLDSKFDTWNNQYFDRDGVTKIKKLDPKGPQLLKFHFYSVNKFAIYIKIFFFKIFTETGDNFCFFLICFL